MERKTHPFFIEVDNIFKNLVSIPYHGDIHSSSFYGDVSNNHKWFFEKDTPRPNIFTFKPCKEEHRGLNNLLDLEKKLNIGEVFFYNRYESNMISIKPDVYKEQLSIRFRVNTLDNSSLTLAWYFNSLAEIDEINKLVNGLYKIVSDIEVFSQEEFFIALEYEKIKEPDCGDNY